VIIIHFLKVKLKGFIRHAPNVWICRKLAKASHISPPSIRIVEDVYKGDLVVHFKVYVHVIIKSLMKFDTRLIAKLHLFAVFD
jgi:hypothetical protein